MTGDMLSTNNRCALETLEWLMRAAFEDDRALSLIANLRNVRDEDWKVLPPDGGRSIADIVKHVASDKWFDAEFYFGPGTAPDDLSPITPSYEAGSLSPQDLIAWLKEGHARWLTGIGSLTSDAELDRPRLAVWGSEVPTRNLIRLAIAHDLYHAGEINHLRALLQKTDQW